MKGDIMRVCALVAVISIWVILEPCYAVDQTLDVGTATGTVYSRVLTNLRNTVKDPNLNYGGSNIPVMAKPRTVGYLLVDITATQGTITIALSTSDLYLQGYADTINGKARGHFFSDIPVSSRTSVFPGVTDLKNVLVFPFGSSYSSMEGNTGAKMSRSQLGLGKNPLNKLINQVYGKAPNAQNEAKLMLVVVQMIAEAMRFKYIENMVVANFDSFYNPDPKAIKLQTSWQSITKGIKNSKNNVISPELVLVDAQGSTWKVSQVNVIANDMGLLKNEG